MPGSKFPVDVCRPKDLPGWMTVTAAGLGGLAYWVTIYPLDQIKSAMSTDSIIVSQRKYPNMAVTAQVGLAHALHAVLSQGL